MIAAVLTLFFVACAQAQFQWPQGWPQQPIFDWGIRPVTPGPSRPVGPVAPQQCSCGVENTGGRIIGGKETGAHQYPWMVALVQPNQPTRQFCGGTLITDRHVLTAAHCFDQTSESGVHVVVGAHKLSQARRTIPVARILRHEQWNPRAMNNDITILVLAQPVQFSETVKPACLPSKDMTRLSNFFVTGWGSLHPTTHVAADALMEVDAPEVDANTCIRKWGISPANQICAGERAHSSCRGDSGGPLQSRVNGKTYHTGIVSFGPPTCANGEPAVYTRVSAYRDWIDARIRDGAKCAN